LQGYYLARSHLRFLTEALLRPLIERQPGHPALEITAAVCTLLDDTYGQALERLTRGSPGCIPSGTTTSCALEATLEVDAEDGEAAELEPGEGWGSQAPPRRAGPGLQEAWRGGIQQAEAPAAGTKQQRLRQDMLSAAARECMRKVAGGLDEVVGLDAIKQVRGCCFTLHWGGPPRPGDSLSPVSSQQLGWVVRSNIQLHGTRYIPCRSCVSRSCCPCACRTSSLACAAHSATCSSTAPQARVSQGQQKTGRIGDGAQPGA
jgi:hypothetical protein